MGYKWRWFRYRRWRCCCVRKFRPTTGTINNGSLSPSFILQRYQTLNRISPSLSGGNPATWEISPALPAGLVFTNGTITGTPTVNMTLTTYTVWANNTGGSGTVTTFNLTIFEPQSNFSYSSSVIVLTRDSAMTPIAKYYWR